MSVQLIELKVGGIYYLTGSCRETAPLFYYVFDRYYILRKRNKNFKIIVLYLINCLGIRVIDYLQIIDNTPRNQMKRPLWAVYVTCRTSYFVTMGI